jgi:hypothetical protein
MIKMLLSSAAVLATVAVVSMATAAGSGSSAGCPMSGCGGGACAMAAATTQPTTQATLYGCPMDKEITSDKPGKCSKCGMKLVPAAKTEKIEAH